MWQLNQTRLNCAAGALGVARAAKEAAVAYCNQRAQFGQKIGEFQMNQDLIAQMIVHEEAARLLVYRAAWLADQQKPNNLETSIGKYTAAEAANFAADAATGSASGRGAASPSSVWNMCSSVARVARPSSRPDGHCGPPGRRPSTPPASGYAG